MTDPSALADIRAAVAAGFAAQVAATAEFVRIPSLRFAEGPAQDFMADALRARGYEVDDWTDDPAALAAAPGWGLREGPVRSVVGTLRPSGPVTGKSLILQGHCDVVPEGPRAMWTDPPFSGAIRDGWMHGRGAGDMKAGTLAALFALDAIRAAGFEPAARVHLQSVIEEESTGLGALATLQRGYRADLCVIPEPSRLEVNRAQVGVLWFRLRVAGQPTHVAVAGEGANAIEAAFHLIAALRRMEADWNARAAADPVYGGVPHPLNFNPGIIRGGDWASSVPAWCEVDCRMGLLPGWSLEACKAEIAQAVSEAARAHRFLADNPPRIDWNGFQAEGYVLGPEADPGLATLRAARADVTGRDAPLPEHRMTALTDTRFYGLYFGIPAFCFGPRARNIHGFDEAVDLASVQEVTETLACLIARWCGLNRLGG